MVGGTGKERKHLSLRGGNHVCQSENGALQFKKCSGHPLPAQRRLGTPRTLPLTVDDQGHVLPVRAKDIGHLAGVHSHVPLRHLVNVQAPISLDGVLAAWGYLDTGREQKAGQTGRSNIIVFLCLWGISRNQSLSGRNMLMQR